MDEKSATRDRILHAAMTRIKHYGYGKTTMAEIAADCDMSPGNIYRFYEAKIDLAEAMARKHYAEHDGKPFFDSLLEFITSGPVVAAIVEGPRAVAAFRQLAGGTDPVEKAAPGSIRGDLAIVTQENIVHGSDSPASAERELALFFG